MSKRMSRIIPAALCGVLGVTSTGAYAAEPTTSELMAQIDQLRAKVEQLEAKPVNQKDVDTTVAQVVADAEKRSQLLQSEGFTAGYSKGKFLIQSADGNFSLNPNAQFQFRSVTNYAESDGESSNIVDGFEVRRMKLGLAGNLFTKNLKYNFVWATNRAASTTTRTFNSPVNSVVVDADGNQIGTGTGTASGSVIDTTADAGGLFLEDAVVEYAINEQFTVKVGQYKVPVHHEELTSSKRQIAVDRTIVNELLGGGYLDRSQGVGLVYKPVAPLVLEVMYHDGANQDNTNFADEAPDYGVAGRVEYTVFGDTKASYGDFSARKNSTDLLVIGGGADYSPNGDSYILAYTVDAQFENTVGTGFYLAYLGFAADGGAGTDEAHDFGGIAQVSQTLSAKLEAFGRYGYVNFDDEGDDDLHEITAGVNYYFYDHSVKGTLDVVYLPEGSPSDSGLGYVASDDSQIVLRAQFQLLL